MVRGEDDTRQEVNHKHVTRASKRDDPRQDINEKMA
jgi:hypothetical protein